jgi:preprotein translocase subunit SecE
VEEALPALQKAHAAQGNQVTVAVDIAQAPTGNAGGGFFGKLASFYRETIAEMKKVTWPDKTQIRQLSIGVIVLSLFVGLLIFVVDWLLQLILVRGIPSIFRG